MKNNIYSLEKIPAITPWFTKKLNQLGITDLFQLALHLPYRWENRSQIVPISQITEAEPVQIQGEIVSMKRPFRSNLPWNLVVEDEQAHLSVSIFFKERPHFKAPFAVGKHIRIYGQLKVTIKATRFNPQRWSMVEPNSVPEQQFTPVYRLTDKLTNARINQFIKQALTYLDDALKKDPINAFLQHEDSNRVEPSLTDALRLLHNRELSHNDPLQHSTHSSALNRLILEELTSIYVAKQLDMEKIRQQDAIPISNSGKLNTDLLERLPFEMTSSQQNVLSKIYAMMNSTKPMATLLQGDVGSGKTIVALMAALVAIDQQLQVALIVPTEILAQQHTNNIRKLLAPLGIEPALLTAAVTSAKRKSIIRDLSSGSLPLLIGTQSLLSESLKWKNLGIVIIDEQHRFGVYQRNKLLMQENATPHLLSMTATPIPRTLMMTLYNNLDLLTIDEMPKNRQEITTVIINQQKRLELITRVKNHIVEGGQVYWICTLIEPNDLFSVKSVKQVEEELKPHLDMPISILHGKMSSKQKTEQMHKFESGAVKLLLSTTVVEVGMDVPNATLVVIDGAERLGLAQMHQIRGRVGRGNKKSFCVLLFDDDISEISKQRLGAMRHISNGFELAEIDLQQRQAGDLTGTDQAGKKTKFIDIRSDLHMLPKALELGKQILQDKTAQQALLVRWQSEERTPETVL